MDPDGPADLLRFQISKYNLCFIILASARVIGRIAVRRIGGATGRSGVYDGTPKDKN